MSTKPKIALVHDELIRRGGAEIVFEELARLYPTADVYALYASNHPVLTINGISRQVHTTFLNKLPLWFRRHPGRVLPLLPYAVEQLDLSAYDIVISSSSGFAKGLVTRASIPHICYCHSPTRYLWDSSLDTSARQGAMRWPLKVMQHYLRLVDFAAAQRPDVFIANSLYTKKRIDTYYRRNSTIIYPPVSTDFFTPPLGTGDGRRHFLVVGRLTASKRFDQAITVCEKLQLPLVVVGTGPEKKRWKRLAGRFTRFAGYVSRRDLRSYLRSARCLLQPGIEDFGLASAEALATGTPVIGIGQGGIREIVEDGKHGLLYGSQRAEALAEAIRRFLLFEQEGRFVPERLQRRSFLFSREQFDRAINNQVDQARHLLNNNSD